MKTIYVVLNIKGGLMKSLLLL